MNFLTSEYLQWIIRFVIGFVFIFAGVEKISDPAAFAEAINNYKILPSFLINFFAIAIPWIEVITGILLIFDKFVKENAVIYTSLMTLFTLMVFVAVLRGLDIDCGCFGTADAQTVGLAKIMENIGLILLGIYIIMVSDSSPVQTSKVTS